MINLFLSDKISPVILINKGKMKIVIDLKEEHLKTMKFLFIWLSIVLWVWYVYFFQWWSNNLYLLIATIFAIYMAINLWANDVANNMWPAVWSKALTLWAAIVIAAIFEAAWALIAWWDVVDTIKWGIIDQSMIHDSKEFITIMLATLLWAALWLNIATFFRAPISTTNSIIWWLIWAWLVAAWPSIVYWWKIWEIVASWVISLIMWWVISVLLFISVKKTILDKEEKWEAAKHWVPIYVWVMMMIFSIYLLLKWLSPILKSNENIANFITPNNAIFIWLLIWVASYVILAINYKNHTPWFFKDKKSFVNKLFNVPLIFAVAILSFAHWSNDVANAIWPLAAINETIRNWWMEIVNSAWVPFWIMLFWALWLSIWLAAFWARLIKTVWNEITKLDQIRAFCVALSAAATVLVASQLWLPVSSTQIALWAIFGIWIYRQHMKKVNWSDKVVIEKSMMKWILLSWIVTLPIAWLISAITYLILINLL